MAQDSGLVELLKWYVESGVDEALAVEPVDRLTRPAPPPPPSLQQIPAATAPPPQRPKQSAELISRNEADRTARAAAEAAADLGQLRDALVAFDGCPLKETAKSLVFADGAVGAKLMFVGEAPGAKKTARAFPSSVRQASFSI